MKEKKFCYLTDSSQRLDALTELCQRLTRFSKVFIYRNFNQSKYKNTKYKSYPIKLQCSSPVNFQSTQSNGNLCRPPESWVLELHETIHILHFGSNALVITIELLTHSLLSLYMSLYVELCKVFLILLDLCSFIQIRSQKQKFIFKSFAQVPRLKVCVCMCVYSSTCSGILYTSQKVSIPLFSKCGPFIFTSFLFGFIIDHNCVSLVCNEQTISLIRN